MRETCGGYLQVSFIQSFVVKPCGKGNGARMAIKLGVQLYSVRNTLGDKPYEALGQIADVGYRYIEGANHDAFDDYGVGFGEPAKKVKKKLDSLDMKMVGCHINPLMEDTLDQVLEYHCELGNKQIGCDIEFFPFENPDFILRRCEAFNKIGEKCKEAGMRFYYHNHYQEFQECEDGKTVYEMIMENTDPKLVFIELDTYWAARAGQNPVQLMKKYKDRIILLHQKDFPEDAGETMMVYNGLVDQKKPINYKIFNEAVNPNSFVEIGQGVLPIASYVNAAHRCPNLECIILEQDHTKLDEIESIKLSMEGFKQFDKIEIS